MVTNRDKFKDAPKFLPEYILIKNKKILILKKNPNVIKFKDAAEPMTALILAEPWRDPEELDEYEINQDSEDVKKARLRIKQMLPSSVLNYPDLN